MNHVMLKAMRSVPKTEGHEFENYSGTLDHIVPTLNVNPI